MHPQPMKKFNLEPAEYGFADEDEDYSPTMESLKHFAQLANRGDQEALARFRADLKAAPELERQVGDLCQRSEANLILQIAEGDDLKIAVYTKQAADMKYALAGKSPPPMERLAAQHVVASWLYLQFATIRVCKTSVNNLPAAKFQFQIRDKADRDFRAAMKNLVDIRRAMKPARATGKETPVAAPIATPKVHALDAGPEQRNVTNG